jgi:hypothetical protein
LSLTLSLILILPQQFSQLSFQSARFHTGLIKFQIPIIGQPGWLQLYNFLIFFKLSIEKAALPPIRNGEDGSVDVGVICGLEDQVGRDVDLDSPIEHDSQVFWAGCIEDACIFEVLHYPDEH